MPNWVRNDCFGVRLLLQRQFCLWGVYKGGGVHFFTYVYLWISCWGKNTHSIFVRLFFSTIFAPSAPSLFICVIGSSRELIAHSQWMATIAKKSLFCSKAMASSPRFDFQMKLCAVWYSAAHGRSVNRRFSCFPSVGNDPAFTSTCRGWGFLLEPA